jgi:ubiquinone/menaquinone biosynthesis C-methylase UbiE
VITLSIEVTLDLERALALVRAEAPDIDVRAEPTAGGTRLVWEMSEPEIDPGEVVAWFASELVSTAKEERIGDWITDRLARRPSGSRAWATYAEPLYHLPNFFLLLETLALGPGDELLEVGCGGGALLRRALRSGCRAAAIDHSEEMVRLAREQNADAIAEGRLEIVQADAHALPFADARFTVAVSTGVFGFLDDPLTALREVHRTLHPGGRLAIFGGTKELRGTPAAPEPVASRVHWYVNDELERLALDAGFAEATVTSPQLERHAREAGLPEEALQLFADSRPSYAQLLVARK